VVYNVRGKDIPIVHRVVRTFPEVEGKAKKAVEDLREALKGEAPRAGLAAAAAG